MQQYKDLFLTMFAPIIWGTSYIVTTEFLPANHPFLLAVFRALPAGLLLMLFVRQLPHKNQLLKIVILGALNFTIFWVGLTIAAYRLPGGIAALLINLTPFVVIIASPFILHIRLTLFMVINTIIGFLGLSLLVVTSNIKLDAMGAFVAIIAACSWGLGTVLTKKWRGNVPLLTFTAWQLIAGGILLLPLTLIFEPNWPKLTMQNFIGFSWMTFMGGSVAYILWFNGITKLNPIRVSILGFLSPITAIILGWIILGQNLNIIQIFGIFIVLAAVIAVNK